MRKISNQVIYNENVRPASDDSDSGSFLTDNLSQLERQINRTRKK